MRSFRLMCGRKQLAKQVSRPGLEDFGLQTPTARHVHLCVGGRGMCSPFSPSPDPIYVGDKRLRPHSSTSTSEQRKLILAGAEVVLGFVVLFD